MNRRLFLRSLAGAVATAVVGERFADVLSREAVPVTALPTAEPALVGQIGRYYGIRFITSPALPEMKTAWNELRPNGRVHRVETDGEYFVFADVSWWPDA